MDHLCYLRLVFVMLSGLFIATFWSPAGKELTSWLLLYPSQTLFVGGILFSRCPSVRNALFP